MVRCSVVGVTPTHWLKFADCPFQRQSLIGAAKTQPETRRFPHATLIYLMSWAWSLTTNSRLQKVASGYFLSESMICLQSCRWLRDRKASCTPSHLGTRSSLLQGWPVLSVFLGLERLKPTPLTAAPHRQQPKKGCGMQTLKRSTPLDLNLGCIASLSSKALDILTGSLSSSSQPALCRAAQGSG